MARKAGPFPDSPFYEVENRRLQKALAISGAVPTGFAATPGSGQGLVTAGTGAELVIAAYPDGALIDGLYVENPDPEPWPLTTNTGNTNPRIDRLVMRLDMDAKTIAPFQIQGTPAASPAAPPLVNTGTVVDMPLCRYTMPGSGSAQNPGSIISERQWLLRSTHGPHDGPSDADGFVTVTHGLGVVPKDYGGVPSGQATDVLNLSVRILSWDADATNFRLRIYRNDNSGVLAGNPIRLMWWANA